MHHGQRTAAVSTDFYYCGVCVYIFTLKTQQAIYNPSQRLERVSPDALKFNLGDLTAILSLCTYQYVDCPKGEGIMEL